MFTFDIFKILQRGSRWLQCFWLDGSFFLSIFIGFIFRSVSRKSVFDEMISLFVCPYVSDTFTKNWWISEIGFQTGVLRSLSDWLILGQRGFDWLRAQWSKHQFENRPERIIMAVFELVSSQKTCRIRKRRCWIALHATKVYWNSGMSRLIFRPFLLQI